MDFDVDEITDENGYITVYTDGSYNFKDQCGGAGAVAQNHVNLESSPVFDVASNISLGQQDNKIGSAHAELLGIYLALKNLPEGSKIRIITDHEDASKFVNNPSEAQNTKIELLKDSPIGSLLRDIKDALSNHEYVESVCKRHQDMTSYEEIYLSTTAHNAAAVESGSQNRKKILTRNNVTLVARENGIQSSYDPNEVIDIKDSPPLEKDLKGPMPIIF